MGKNIGWEWERFNPLNGRAGTYVIENCTCSVPASQSQGRGDFELDTHTVTLKHKHRRSHSFNMTKGSGRTQHPSLAAAFEHTWLPSCLVLAYIIISHIWWWWVSTFDPTAVKMTLIGKEISLKTSLLSQSLRRPQIKLWDQKLTKRKDLHVQTY